MYQARYHTADGDWGPVRELPDGLFDGVVNESALHRVVRAHLANRRQGTASAKNRTDVAGGSRKPWRQKGTGRARQGTIRAVQWRGGGVAFPPSPKSWRERVPKKVKRLARRSALNARAKDDRVILTDSIEFEEPKTRRLVEFLAAVEAEGKVLILTHGNKRNLYLSGRNLGEVEVRPFGEESPYDILWAKTILIEVEAIEAATATEGGEDA